MEICVDSLESAIAAYEGGASRIELCSSLNEGGLTPSLGLLKSIRDHVTKSPRPTKFSINCMIRCRVGDFDYSDTEMITMLEDAKKFVEIDQIDGLVFGALTPEGNVDETASKEFLNCLRSNFSTTFHRAFDVCRDWQSAHELINSLGFDKLLTSGQQKTAFEGRHLIAKLVELETTNRLRIIAGAGINENNLVTIMNETKCSEFHASCRSWRESRMSFRNVNNVSMGSPTIDEFKIAYADKTKVKALVDIVQRDMHHIIR